MSGGIAILTFQPVLVVILATSELFRHGWNESVGVVDGTSVGEMGETAYNLAENVKFEVNACSGLDGVEVSMLEGVGNDVYLKRVVGRVAHGKAHTIDGDRTLIDREVAVACHFSVKRIFKRVGVAAFGIVDACADGGFVNMALYDVTVQTGIDGEGTLHVDFTAHGEVAQIGAFEGFFHRRRGICVARYGGNGEAHAVVCQTFGGFEFVSEGTLHGENYILSVVFNGNDRGHAFDDA